MQYTACQHSTDSQIR